MGFVAEAARKIKALGRKARADRRGATAVEFAMIAFPTLFTLAAIFEIGLTFYMGASLDYATKHASRNLQTGAAQTGGLTASQVQAQVCSYLPSAFTCANIFVNITALTAPAYISSFASPYRTPYYNYVNANQSALNTPPLNASQDSFSTTTGVGACWLIVIQVAYPASSLLSFLTPSGATTFNGASVNVLSSATTFLTEPYPGTTNAATTGC